MATLERVSSLLDVNGVFALTFMNRPAGLRIHVHRTDGKRTISDASGYGLEPVLVLENQPSLMDNKEKVTWSKLVFKK